MTSLVKSMKYVRICIDISVGKKIAYDQVPSPFTIKTKVLNKTGV